MRRASRTSAFLLVVGMLMTILGVSPLAEASQQHKCIANLGLSADQVKATSSKIPLIAIHGYHGKPGDWANGDPSMASVIEGIEDTTTDYFNYEKVNSRWVTDSEIAPRLAQYIACYHLLSKRPVILLAHSMGGLAAREALDSAAYGVHSKDAVGHVITIGTPHKGSRYADLESYFWLSACEAPFGALLADACKQINAARATGGMRIGSEQLAKLAHFPAGVSVKAIAGEVSWQACLPWGCSPSASTGGDLVVPVDSATAEYTKTGHGDGKKVFVCETSSSLLSPWTEAWCDHNKMLQASQVQSEVTNSIRQYLRHVELTENGGQFVGDWQARDVTLTFNADGTGKQVIDMGVCFGSTDYHCQVIIEFTWQPESGGLDYTVRSIKAIAHSPADEVMPADDEIDTSEFEQPGMTLPVKSRSPGLIERDPGGARNWYFCRHELATPEEQSLCA